MLIALLVIAAVWVLVKLLPVVLMFVAALVLVGTLNPIVGWLETNGSGAKARSRSCLGRPSS